MDKCYNSTTNATSLDSVCHEYWFTNAPSITAIAPLSVEDGTDVWVFKSKSELDSSLPISKPLLVDCPMPVCAFGISGPYADLQRCLIYANLVLAIIAAATPILRGVAQLYLATTGMSATVHYFAILGLRDRHFIDMDILPALMYAFSGFIATMFWSMLRVSSVITSFRQVMTYQVLPYAVAFLYLVLVCILLVICPDKPAAVLLESDTAYRLTSICYKDGTGSVVPWSGYLSYSIRQSSELQFILPPDGSSGQSAETFLIPLKWTAIGAFVMVGAYFLFLLLIIIKSRTRWSRGEPWEVDLSFLACFPKPLQRLFSPGLAPSGLVQDRVLVLTPDFRLTVMQTALYVAGYLVFVVHLEKGIRKHHLPQGETPNQYSQWGTWVISVFVAIVTIVMQAPNKEKDGYCDDDS